MRAVRDIAADYHIAVVCVINVASVRAGCDRSAARIGSLVAAHWRAVCSVAAHLDAALVLRGVSNGPNVSKLIGSSM